MTDPRPPRNLPTLVVAVGVDNGHPFVFATYPDGTTPDAGTLIRYLNDAAELVVDAETKAFADTLNEGDHR